MCLPMYYECLEKIHTIHEKLLLRFYHDGLNTTETSPEMQFNKAFKKSNKPQVYFLCSLPCVHNPMCSRSPLSNELQEKRLL